MIIISWVVVVFMLIWGIAEVSIGDTLGIVYIIGSILMIFILIFSKIYLKEKLILKSKHSIDNSENKETSVAQQIYDDNKYIQSDNDLLDFFEKVEELKNNTRLCELINSFVFDTEIIDFFMKIIVNISKVDILGGLKCKNYKEQIKKSSNISKNLSLSNKNIHIHIQTYKYETLSYYREKKINISYKEFPQKYSFPTYSFENILYFKDSLILNNIISSEKIDIDCLYFLLWVKKENSYRKMIQDLYEDYDFSDNTDLETKVNILFYDSPLQKSIIIKLLCVENYLNQDEVSLSTIINNSEIKTILENIYNKIESKEFLNKLSYKQDNAEDDITDISKIDMMSGYQFEDFIMKLFEKMGYAVEHTPLSGDQGVDLIVKKGAQTIAIQTKCFRTKKIGNKAIQEVVAGAKFYGANKMIVITNSYFTRSAIELASIHNVELWDRNILSSKIQR